MPVALPDILSGDDRYVYMRSQRFDPNGQRRQIALLPLTEQAGDAAHLFCQIGFLDDSWFFRSFWMYGQAMGGGYGGWFRAGRLAPSGRMMVFDDKAVYWYARKPEYMTNASVLEYELYAADKRSSPKGFGGSPRTKSRSTPPPRRTPPMPPTGSCATAFRGTCYRRPTSAGPRTSRRCWPARWS
jgi:hypothetical protein